VAESEIAELLSHAERTHAGVAIGSYPFYRGGMGVTLVARSPDRARLAAAAAALRALLEARAPGAVVETPPGAAEA
jgi:hypothetical protein